MKDDLYKLWPDAQQLLDKGNWRLALIHWAIVIEKMISKNSFKAKYAKYTREIVKIAKKDCGDDEVVARTACQDILIGAVTNLVNTGRAGKRLPKLTNYFACEHERKIFWLNSDYKEWILQWAYWAFAGRLATHGGLARLFIVFGFLSATIFSFFYIGGLEWTDRSSTDPILWYHYFYFSGLTLTTLGYGDLHPIPSSMFHCFISIIEAVVGYLLLGLMVSGFIQFNTMPSWPHKEDINDKIKTYLNLWDIEQSLINSDENPKMNIESIPLTEREIEIIEDLRAEYGELSDEFCTSIGALFRQTRILLTAVAERADNGLFESHLALLGILNRAHELLQGGIQQVTCSNRHVWGACFRGLIETYGAIAWVNEKPSSLPSLIQNEGTSIGKLLAVAYKRINGLKKSYKSLSSLVHPQSKSLLLGMIPLSGAQMHAFFAVPAPSLSENEVKSGLEDLVGICVLIHEEIQALIDLHPEVINSGKLVGRIEWKGKPPDSSEK
ncbi:MAG: two pore domain potassium channel family protein [Candidatus Glassbacteria bacterium]|nr:two pore domain potassium channel family protein [Candidatus Glassbacteria bacterium]